MNFNIDLIYIMKFNIYNENIIMDIRPAKMIFELL